MRIILAPDSYKGSLSALAVADAMERGIRDVFPDAAVSKVPIADGGEGTVEALITATSGRIIQQKIVGPLGEVIDSYWGILGDGETGVIELAAASGLPLVPREQRNPLLTTTFGTGQLIKAVLDYGLRKLIIGIGGSATNDGGAGMAQALGVKFLDSDDNELSQGGGALAKLARIDLSDLDKRIAETDIKVACDVDNPLYGPLGASAVYGPQKGATSDMVAQLDHALKNYAAVAQLATRRDVALIPGAGAAGGVGAGLLFFTNAKLIPGIQIVLEAADFAEKLKQADLVITGEGSTDFQTAHGKAPVGVAKIAKEAGIPTICLSGGLGSGAEDVLQHGIDGLMSIVPRPMELEQCIESAEELIQAATARICRLISIGIKMK